MTNWTPQDAPAQVTTAEHDVTGFESMLKDLAGKTEGQLRSLYADALTEEAEAKKELYMLRKRVANLGTDVETDEEVLLKSAKQRVATGISYLKALELKLSGRPATPTTN